MFVGEGDGIARVCVAVEDGSAEAEIAGSVSIVDGSAVGQLVSISMSNIVKLSSDGPDYTPPASTNFIIAAGTAEACLDFTIIDDDAFEGNEFFTIHLAVDTSGVNIGSFIYSTVNIIDNDGK